MNSTVSLTSLNQSNTTKVCCICLENKSVDIPLINCNHRYEFCNECILHWFEMKKFDSPICRQVWQEKECVSQTKQFEKKKTKAKTFRLVRSIESKRWSFSCFTRITFIISHGNELSTTNRLFWHFLSNNNSIDIDSSTSTNV